MITITLKGSVPSKKNNKQITYRNGRLGLRSSDNYLAWNYEQLMTMKRVKPIKGPVRSIAITFFIDSKRKTDLTNKAESVMDLLVDAGIIEDDNCFIVPYVLLIFGGVDKTNPRALVNIDPE